MKFLRLLFVSLICWPVGLVVEAIMLVLAVPANLIGIATLWRYRNWHNAVPLNPRFPRWLWLWDNDEDTILGPLVGRNPSEIRWCNKAARWPLWRRILSWNLLRNPASNLRFTRWGVYVNPWFVEMVGNSPNPERDWSNFDALDSDSAVAIGLMKMTAEEFIARAKEANRSGPPYWCWARQGWRSGLWIVRAGNDGKSVTHRLGWAICPQPLSELSRYAGFKCQPWRRG